jgi:PAS domain S-box-containing protein
VLSGSADEQVRVITLWLGERQADAEEVAENPFTVRLLSGAENGDKIVEARRSIERDVERIIGSNRLLAGALVDRQCQIVAGAGLREGSATDFQAVCKWVFQTGEFEVIASGWEQGNLHLNLAVPVFAAGGSAPSSPASRRATGAVVLVSDPWSILQPFIAPGSERRRSSETLLVWKQDDDAVIFAPSRKMRGEASLFRTPLSDTTLEARVAREGNVSFAEFKDHRGIRVFGAGRQIPVAGDNLVRKVDRDQAFSEYHRQAVLEGLVGALSILLFGCVFVAQHRQLATCELKEKLRQQQTLLELRQHAAASEARYRSLFDRNLAGVFRSTLDGQILDYNPAVVKIFGYPVNEAERSMAQNLYFSPIDRQNLIAHLLKERSITNHEIRLRRRDGSPVWALLSAHLLDGEVGQRAIIEGTVIDITERKALEDQLRQAQKMEAIGRLAGGVAHDFNNLLTAILGYAHLILGELRQGDPLRGNVDEIHRAAQRASALTQQLLAFSRKQVLQPRVLDLNAIITNSARMLSRLIGEDIELNLELDPNLVPVKADACQIEQVLLNLAVNSRDAMPRGGQLHIATATLDAAATDTLRPAITHSGPWILLTVRDNGCGMDAEVRSRLFEPFFTTKEPDKGTGLGLSTVYGIIIQSGGDIWVDSQPGQGTRFHILLPGTSTRLEKEEAAIQPGVALGRETILVVEDEGIVRRLTCQILRLNGYQVLEAANGGEAVSLCERHSGKIHLMITDVIMPQMSGYELAGRLACLRPQMKVLYMSGYIGDRAMHSCLESNVDLIQKPFSPAALSQKVREVLEAPP